MRWEPPEGPRAPRIGDHSDSGGVWRIREGAEVRFPPEDIEEKAVGYGSVAMAKAHQLTVGGIIEAVPVPGAGGSIPVEDWCEGEHRRIVECPEEMIKEPEEDPPETRVLVREEDRDGLRHVGGGDLPQQASNMNGSLMPGAASRSASVSPAPRRDIAACGRRP